MKRNLSRFGIAWLICLLLAKAYAKPSPSEDECLISTDFHIVHFSAFQPGASQQGNRFKRYCQQLPRVALSYFGIDFLDRDVRQLPVALAVVEENSQGKPVRTLTEIAPKIYSQGVASLQVNFDRPGHYAVLVRFQGEEMADELRIPLTVASISRPWWPIVVGGTFAGLGLGLSLYAWRRKR